MIFNNHPLLPVSKTSVRLLNLIQTLLPDTGQMTMYKFKVETIRGQRNSEHWKITL